METRYDMGDVGGTLWFGGVICQMVDYNVKVIVLYLLDTKGEYNICYLKKKKYANK